MLGDLLEPLVTRWKAIWDAFNDAGPLANAIQIIGFFAACAGVGRWYVHRRLKDKDGQILLLKEDVASRDKKLDESWSKRKDLERICTELESQLPRTALTRAEREIEEGNQVRANRVLLNWLEREGESISELLLHRAKWAAAHAVGEARDLGLVVAEASAIAATVFARRIISGIDLVEDIERLRVEEGQAMPSLNAALGQFDDHADALFDVDRVSEAAAAEDEAYLLYRRRYYHLALPVVERALVLRMQTVGRHALQTFAAQRLKAYILIGLGHSEEALPSHVP